MLAVVPFGAKTLCLLSRMFLMAEILTIVEEILMFMLRKLASLAKILIFMAEMLECMERMLRICGETPDVARDTRTSTRA